MNFSGLPVYVILVAGGSGQRMGSQVPKQFLDLCGKPVLYYTILAFAKALPRAEYIVVLPKAHFSTMQSVLAHLPQGFDVTLTPGGASRFESTKAGLRLVPEGEAIVLVHDGVRPFPGSALILDIADSAEKNGAAVPVLPMTDTVVKGSADGAYQTVDRSQLCTVQTPQGFRAEVLKKAFEQEWQEYFTDEASVVAAAGFGVSQVAGQRKNIKITTPEDLSLAQALLQLNL